MWERVEAIKLNFVGQLEGKCFGRVWMEDIVGTFKKISGNWIVNDRGYVYFSTIGRFSLLQP